MFDQPNRFTFRGETYVVHHGDPFDRGSADSYYGRPRDPHRGGVGGDSGPRVSQLNEQELQEYHAGYDYNEQFGDKKNYL
jgi:hypothetical protein